MIIPAIPAKVLDALWGKDPVVFLDTVKIDKENYRSFLFTDPVTVLETSETGKLRDALASLDEHLARGFYAAGYLSYEAGYAFQDRLLERACPVYPHPLLWFGIYREPLIADLRLSADDISDTAPDPRCATHRPVEELHYGISEQAYNETIKKIKSNIRAGEVYQLNFTMKSGFDSGTDPVSLYRSLRETQPVSYGAFIRHGGRSVFSFSPELFFRRDGDRIAVMPMKGTMARGRTADEDKNNARRLGESEKDRAENLMIVDLMRNDLNRICRSGSVEVTGLFNVEKYETLFQMTSRIEGDLRPGISCADIFASLFPCGSVTGAPKTRAMELISEMESGYRGVYTGAVGFMSPDREAVFNVAIRTPEITKGRGTIGSGGGIVWDSDPVQEYSECLLKMDFLKRGKGDFRLIETMLVDKGSCPYLEMHIARARESAWYFNFYFDDAMYNAKINECLHSLDADKKYRLRVLAGRRGDISINVSVIENSFSAEALLALAGPRTNSRDVFLYHKTTRRELYDRMHGLAVKNRFDDVVFLNERGEITEGSISNIFIERNGALITPPVTCGLLKGVMRDTVMGGRGNVAEEVITLEDLVSCDAVYISNSVRGMRKAIFSGQVLS
jgi:para-aminobenzoate synthetase / 4-amino-4-deoxychorismate lyase